MKVVPLSQIADFINGHAFKPSDWGDEGLKIIRIQNLTDGNKPFNRTAKEVPDKYLIQKGDLLVSWSATLGVFEWKDDENALLNQHIFKVEPKLDIIDKSFFKYVLKYSIEKMLQFTHGSTMKHIVRGDFLNHKIPLPSLEEQRKIVNILDHADTLRQKRQQAIGQLDEYLKSVFLDMFGDPVINPKKINIRKLEKLATKITDGTHVTPKYVSEGIKFISAKNVKEESIDWTDIKYITQEEHELLYKRCNPQKGDLLLTKSGSLGMVAIVDVDFEFSLFESLALIKLEDDQIDPIYLREYLNLNAVKKFYLERTKGVGVKHLHFIDIKSLPILLPPMSDQKKFVQIVLNAESTKEKMIHQSIVMDTQFQALIQKSFSAKS